MSTDESRLGLALIMLEHATLCDREALRASLERNLPRMPVTFDQGREEHIHTFSAGDSTFFVALMPGPVPWNQLESLCDCAWHWKDATAKLKNHQAHLVVTTTDGPADPLDSAILLTRICGAILEVEEAGLGVYWGGPAICSRDMFLQVAKSVSRANLEAVLAWVSFNIVKEPWGYSIMTQGMEKFGHLEFELLGDRTSPDAIEFALDLAMYVLDQGPVLKAGQTFGRNAREQFPISVRPWRWDQTKNAIILDLRSPKNRS